MQKWTQIWMLSELNAGFCVPASLLNTLQNRITMLFLQEMGWEANHLDPSTWEVPTEVPHTFRSIPVLKTYLWAREETGTGHHFPRQLLESVHCSGTEPCHHTESRDQPSLLKAAVMGRAAVRKAFLAWCCSWSAPFMNSVQRDPAIFKLCLEFAGMYQRTEQKGFLSADKTGVWWQHLGNVWANKPKHFKLFTAAPSPLDREVLPEPSDLAKHSLDTSAWF